MRVWLWHNGTHEETLAVVKEYVDHPHVYKFHHSLEDVKLHDPTNWILEEGNPEVSAGLVDVPDPFGVLKDSLLSVDLSLIVGHSDLLGHHLL